MKVHQFTSPVVNNYSIVVQEDVAPYFYNYLHRHDDIQITLILKGEGTIFVGNYTQTCSPGDIYFIGKNQPHVFRSNPDHFEHGKKTNVHAIHIFFDPRNNLSQLFSLPEMEMINEFLALTTDGLQLPAEKTKQISVLIKEIRDAEPLDRILILVKLLSICATQVKNWKSLSTGFANFPDTDTNGVRMNDVYQYTYYHYAEPITLNKIASVACITPHSFCKYFKKHTRKTYLSFLNEIRINEACKKIMRCEFESIAEVAYSTGFNSIATFNRVFKKHTSMPPKSYIMKYRQSISKLAFENIIN